MLPNIMKYQLAFFVIILGSLVPSCSVSRTQVQQQASKVVAEAVASHTPELVQTTRLGSFIVRHVSKEPVELLSVPTSDRNKGLVMNFENVSERAIKSVEYGISRHEECAEYMYVFTPSPRMIYGDNKGEIPIGPGGQTSLRVPPSIELRKLLDSRTYASCSGDNKSPILMLEEVRFSDGSIWRPRARAF
jgi:hypothetical protein